MEIYGNPMKIAGDPMDRICGNPMGIYPQSRMMWCPLVEYRGNRQWIEI
jgi:hypothetical protein